MVDTIEGLSAELEQQKRTNTKLLDLLRKVDAALPESHDRVSGFIGGYYT